MREQMIYNPGIYQLREDALKRMLDIIYNQKTAQSGQTVFFGDSIIEFYDMNQYFPEKTIIIVVLQGLQQMNCYGL